MAYKRILLKRGKEDSLRRFHPWVFSGAIARLDDGIEEGDVVDVCTNDGKFIAVGHYQIGSIAVRVLDFAQRAIDKAFLQSAYKRLFNCVRVSGLFVLTIMLSVLSMVRVISFPVW